MGIIRNILLTLGSCLAVGYAFASSGNETNISQASYHLPQKVTAVKRPVISLNGTWQFKYSPTSEWTKIQVPGEAAMQGYAIEHDKPFTYRRSFLVPKDYSGKSIILRFDGVYNHARLFVNGQFIREHHGGFTRWETDITPNITIGKENEIQVEVTDRIDDISYASGYAHHPIGGILRNVTVFALPQTHLYDFHTETHLDSSYEDAILKISYMPKGANNARVEYTLIAPDGKKVPLQQSSFTLHNGANTNELPVKRPLKWDAEHPNLYTLTVTLYTDNRIVSTTTHRIGFREVKIEGDRMLVNGMPVKLRGACRHDIHPQLGRTTTAELDSLDALLFKKSNMNFVRTSHYPPSEKFLEYCDRFGIYVECETAVCFVDTYRQKNYAPGQSQNNAEFTPRYLSQCHEMVKSFRSHPAILFWSIGNESVYGENFQKSWDWVKATDHTRPVIFSYPGSIGDKKPIYDILSMHYQDVNGNLDQWNRSTRNFQGHGIPALFDEWAHPACYTYATLQNDPNIREFWGISLDKMWSGLFDAQGGLGGAIWGYIDETFMLPVPKFGKPFWIEFARTAKPQNYQGNCVGYGEWGIVDVWRREKPEFWSTKKAYSPVKLLTTQIEQFVPGQALTLPIYNRFDHTNLNEIKIYYTYGRKEQPINSPSLAPHQKGKLIIPGNSWKEGEEILICFLSPQGELIDAELVTLGRSQKSQPTDNTSGLPLQIEETSDRLIVKGEGFEIPFSKENGLIHNATVNGKTIIEKGPFLHLDINLNHLTGAEVRKSANKFTIDEADWKKESFTYAHRPDQVVVSLKGKYKETVNDMEIRIFPSGKISISYSVAGAPNGYVRETGIALHLPEKSVSHLEWQRKGYWSYYPANSFAGNSGMVPLYNKKKVCYGSNPGQPWGSDTHNYYYWADAGANCSQPLTQTAKGMKENIYYYTLSSGKGKEGISVQSSEASLACRLYKPEDGKLSLYVNNKWDYPEIAWGNYCKTLEALPCKGQMEFILQTKNH